MDSGELGAAALGAGCRKPRYTHPPGVRAPPSSDRSRATRRWQGVATLPRHRATASTTSIELELSPGAATIVEVRAPWREDYGPAWTRSPVARLRYTMRTGVWVLYARDYRGHPDPPRFRRYPFTGPSAKIGVLIDEIERDPICIFWG